MKFGLALLLVAGLIFWWSTRLRSEYQREVSARLEAQVLSAGAETPMLAESDLAHLPAVVQRYVRLSGAVGLPKVRNLKARFRGRIRGGADEPWMSFDGEQHNFFDNPARLFYMDAKKSGVPVQVFHQYVGASATMRVRIASFVPVVNAAGPEMDESETVTMFNDMCWLAAGSLISDRIQWEEIDSLQVRARFANAGHTVHATLQFNSDGELSDFISDDRSAASADGKSFTRMRWSTPMYDYRAFGAHRASSRGEGVWHASTGAYTYIELELVDLRHNVTTH